MWHCCFAAPTDATFCFSVMHFAGFVELGGIYLDGKATAKLC